MESTKSTFNWARVSLKQATEFWEAEISMLSEVSPNYSKSAQTTSRSFAPLLSPQILKQNALINWTEQILSLAHIWHQGGIKSR